MGSSSRLHSHSTRSRSSKNSYILQCMEEFDSYTARQVGIGASAIVLAVNEHLAVKQFADSSVSRKDLRREVKVFKQLNQGKKSPNIVKFYGRWGNGVVLERLDMTLRQRLDLGYVSMKLENQWMLEITEGLAFLHSKDVLHGDFSCQNVLIGSDGHAKICDFAGSKLGGKKATAQYQVRSQHPRYLGRQPRITTEIFALGSVVYEITTLQPPYEHLCDSDVQQQFGNGEFPLNSIYRPEIRDIVEKCWTGVYDEVSEVCEDLESL